MVGGSPARSYLDTLGKGKFIPAPDNASFAHVDGHVHPCRLLIPVPNMQSLCLLWVMFMYIHVNVTNAPKSGGRDPNGREVMTYFMLTSLFHVVLPGPKCLKLRAFMSLIQSVAGHSRRQQGEVLLNEQANLHSTFGIGPRARHNLERFNDIRTP